MIALNAEFSVPKNPVGLPAVAVNEIQLPRAWGSYRPAVSESSPAAFTMPAPVEKLGLKPPQLPLAATAVSASKHEKKKIKRDTDMRGIDKLLLIILDKIVSRS